MGRGLFLGLMVAWILNARSLDAQIVSPDPCSLSAFSTLLRAAYRTLVPVLFRENVERHAAGFLFDPQADGGSGDGGSGDGGSGDGGSGDGGSGDGGSGDGTDDSTGPTDNSAPSDNTGPDAVAPPTDPTTETAVDFAAQQAFDAVVNPFGGFPGPVVLQNGTDARTGANPVPGSPTEPGSPGGPGRGPRAFPPAPTANTPPPPRAQIHAVIASNLSDPSQILTGSVNLTGGIIALGSANSPTPQKAGRWDPNVTVTPDPELLNGDKIPPLVPNVIDVRIMHHEVSATIESAGSTSGQP
jgi:hypothetical protein